MKIMESDEIRKLREMLESGVITKDVYDEILSRWGNSGNSNSGPTEKESTGQERTRNRGETIRVSGSSSLSDVYVKEIRVSGSSNIEGNCDANVIHISGSTGVGGDVISSDTIKVSGSMRVKGKILGNSVSSSGSLHASEIHCRNLDSSGSIHISGSITAEEAHLSGSCEAKNLKVNDLESSGSIRAEIIESDTIVFHGNIRSENVICRDIEIEIYNTGGRIKNLEAESIIIVPKMRIFSHGYIQIDQIKCKKGDFDGLRSSRVVGDDLHFGPNCNIDYAEGKKITIEDGANIREKKIVE